jgi:predicted SprT family Zn-dependent metalloprotease
MRCSFLAVKYKGGDNMNVHKRIQEVINFFEKKHGRGYSKPSVVWFDNPAYEGWAVFDDWQIWINKVAYQKNKREILKNGIPHEVIHLLANLINPFERFHGRTWRKMMREFGCEPTVYSTILEKGK